MGIRPEHIYGGEMEKEKTELVYFDVDVKVYEMLGANALIYFDVDQTGWVASLDTSIPLKCGDQIRLGLDAEMIHVFDCDTEKTITN